MHQVEVLFALLVVVAALAALARRLAVPQPILMLVGGLVLGLLPIVPRLELAPETVLVVFLPPLLYVAAFYTSIRDFRANGPAIASLSFGLVVATAAAVAVAARLALPALSWPVAFALGAIVAPPDAAAATAVMQRLGAPRRVVTILEGESMLNDATALVAYRIALAAAVSGAFSLGDAAARFVLVAAGGAAVGYVVARVVAAIRRRAADTPVSITVSLVTPFAAYLPAEAAGASGVIAVVVAGLHLGRHAPRFMSSETRITGGAVWQMLVFLLSGLLFLLLGLQLPLIVSRLEAVPPRDLIGVPLAVTATAIAVRFAWVFAGTYLAGPVRRAPAPPWQESFVISWAGMRGAVSLAAAFALPLGLDRELPFARDLLIFATFVVILATLVGQGVTLPVIMRRLGVTADPDVEHDEAHARVETAQVALERLEEMRARWGSHAELLDALAARYAHRVQHADLHHEGPLGAAETERLEHRQIRQELIDAERAAAREMHARGAIDDVVLRRLERDLDLEELRSED
ncbi:MAG TPA: Na+/H+ antiporter [Candidatus Limnocylindria bacterium]|nr:Na+/H+ antiporter [Candidatus Limnocylindria bacterium]